MEVFDVTGPNVTALIALGMAAAFYFADRNSATSRMLALTMAAVGLSILGNVNLVDHQNPDTLPAWSGLTAIPTALGVIFGAQWVILIRRTIPSVGLRTVAGDNVLRMAQIMAVVYAILSLVLYQWRVEYYLSGLGNADAWLQPRFWIFALPYDLAIMGIAFGTLITLNRKPDKPEAVRLLAFACGAPFIAAGVYLPQSLAPYSVAVGEVMVLAGALNYHILQGQRGAFMTRFLAPQVADMVRRQGLNQAMDNTTQDLSVVACDLRGFTAYAEAVSSAQVIKALQDYYQTIGTIAADYGATIKDYAGDGILLLVGAPITYEDHAQRAVDLAREIIQRSQPLLHNWSMPDHTLGIGVGVASGRATIGIVGGERLEYAAVGTVVNLASRLCDAAQPGQALIDPETVKLTQQQDQLRKIPAIDLKGLSEPVAAYRA